MLVALSVVQFKYGASIAVWAAIVVPDAFFLVAFQIAAIIEEEIELSPKLAPTAFSRIRPGIKAKAGEKASAAVGTEETDHRVVVAHFNHFTGANSWSAEFISSLGVRLKFQVNDFPFVNFSNYFDNILACGKHNHVWYDRYGRFHIYPL